MKMRTGTLKGDTVVYNVNKDAEEKIGKVYIMRGKEVIEVPELKAGDIGAVAKLTVTGTRGYHGSPYSTDRLPQTTHLHTIYIHGLQGSQ